MSEPRYVKQRDKFSCGPVAIMNVLKWAGVELSHDETIKPFRTICRCDPEVGTNHPNFDRALRLITDEVGGIKVRRVYKPKLPEIEQHLREEGIVILNYHWRYDDEWNRHFMLLVNVSESGKSFLTVNDNRKGPALKREMRETVKKNNFRFQRVDPHFKAWFISLKE